MLTPNNIDYKRWNFRITKPEELQKIEDLYIKSGAKNKSEFARTQLLNEHFKIIKVDPIAVDYNRQLYQFILILKRLGNLYNQTVKAINTYNSPKVAVHLLAQLNTLQEKIIFLEKKLIELTTQYKTEAKDLNDCQN